MKQSRSAGFGMIAMIYVVALIIGGSLFLEFKDVTIFWRILISDVGATVFIYITGVILSNASVYDPYWSVAPIVIFTGVALFFNAVGAGTLLLLIAVWYWGLRLTYNWAYTFENLNTQDWRYDHYKDKFPHMFQLVSFFGINMFPTIVVYICLLPGIVFIENNTLNTVTVVGFLVCVLAATLQLIADLQMHRFRRTRSGGEEIIRIGLWKYSRHPNYLGEILMWWGVYIMMLSASPQMWFLCIGPTINTLMFLFVSIPLADKRNRKLRPGFDEYINETRSLLPLRK